MTSMANIPILSKAWLSELLFTRELFQGPTGLPLYSYQVTEEEYLSLCKLLKTNRAYAFNPIHSTYWAACFCLYVAETFRREYDASEGGWKWDIFEKRISCEFSHIERGKLVEHGLERYWKRPIRQRERGRDLLGSLFAEGGLPWKLLQSDSHGFGRAVRGGLKNFYSNSLSGRTTTDLMSDYEHYWPQSFQTLETRQLLGGIVEQLMFLAEHYPLKEQADPASYLDATVSSWRQSFPIPLNETNGRELINQWLKDADRRRQERKEQEEAASAFTCIHRLAGELPHWHVISTLKLPKTLRIQPDFDVLNSYRFELGFYEGDKLIARAGPVYGQLGESWIDVRISDPMVTVERRDPREPLTMRLLESGRQVQIFHFDDSALLYDEEPLTFEWEDDRWLYVASSSCSLMGGIARVSVPAGFEIINGNVEKIAEHPSGLVWLEAQGNLVLRNNEDLYVIKANQPGKTALQPVLVGTNALYDSLPVTVYRGAPRLTVIDGIELDIGQLRQYINGRPTDGRRIPDLAGCVRYSVKNPAGETVLQRRFGIIPERLEIALYPASGNRQARIVVRNGKGLDIRVAETSIRTKCVDQDYGSVIYLEPEKSTQPSSLTLRLSSDKALEPVRLRFPYPYQGVTVFSGEEEPFVGRELTLDDLLGARIQLSAGLPQGQRFYLFLELLDGAGRKLRPSRQYQIIVGSSPVQLSLFSYHNDIYQMLGSVADQDSFVRLRIETDTSLLRLDIRRYKTKVIRDNAEFSLVGITDQNNWSGAVVEAMLLSDPKQKPVLLPERISEGVGMGVFEATVEMNRKGPWLVYPKEGSPVQFRPTIYPVADLAEGDMSEHIHSLHAAAQRFHPKFHPDVIDEQIAVMAEDLAHSGWQYLADLKKLYRHLPLSAFESWLALSRHPKAQAFALFRLELDEAFCRRISNELAVLWEAIPLPLWTEVFITFRNWLAGQGLPEILVDHVLANRKQVLTAVVSGLDHVVDQLENLNTVKFIGPEHVLPGWYQELRHRHEATSNWPTDLGSELRAWVRNQTDLPDVVKGLSLARFTNAVTYLPIFMGYVTAGKAELADLDSDTSYTKFAVKVLSDFDRSNWYTPVHALIVSHVLASSRKN